MADGDGVLPVEGNDSSSHSEARSYSFDTIGQVLIQLAYNLQERRYGGGRGDFRRGGGGNEDMFPLSEELQDSESLLPTYTPLSPPGQIDQPRQVCQIGDRRHQPGGSQTPPAIQGVRREDRYEPLSEQTVEERRHNRRQEERQERHPPRQGEYRRDDAWRRDDEIWDKQTYAPPFEEHRGYGRHYGWNDYEYEYRRRDERRGYEPKYSYEEERGRPRAHYDGERRFHIRQGERQDP